MVSMGVTPILEVATIYEEGSRWYLRDEAERDPMLCLVPSHHAELARTFHPGDRVMLETYHRTRFEKHKAIMLQKFSAFAQPSLPIDAVKYLPNPLVYIPPSKNEKSTMTDSIVSIFPKLESATCSKGARIGPQVFCRSILLVVRFIPTE